MGANHEVDLRQQWSEKDHQASPLQGWAVASSDFPLPQPQVLIPIPSSHPIHPPKLAFLGESCHSVSDLSRLLSHGVLCITHSLSLAYPLCFSRAAASACGMHTDTHLPAASSSFHFKPCPAF